MKTVIVASENPVKLQAAETAFKTMFPDEHFKFVTCPAKSGVPDQPKNHETLLGARNRVKHCREMYPDADFFAAMEGGIMNIEDNWEVCAWMVIEDQEGREGKAHSACHPIPKKIQKLLDEGLELGDATDQAFNQKNSKQQGGTIGIMTKGAVTRADYYVQPLIFALVPFKNKELFADA